ncbi:lytic transglycosylase domain-containing protein [Rhizobium sp. L1K21]|nr:lytic transglycosylase domain-containing protein [Rhizobium sp. L1K21]
MAMNIAANGTAFAGSRSDDEEPKVTLVSLLSTKGAGDIAEDGKSLTSPYSKLIKTYAKKYGVPESLAHAVVKVESNFNPKARGRAGEIGLMQIKPATARAIGYSGSSKGLYDPETNIQFGMKYLAMAQELGGGETCNTILKYNAGHGARRMNPVSAAYCQKVKAIMD